MTRRIFLTLVLCDNRFRSDAKLPGPSGTESRATNKACAESTAGAARSFAHDESSGKRFGGSHVFYRR